MREGRSEQADKAQRGTRVRRALPWLCMVLVIVMWLPGLFFDGASFAQTSASDIVWGVSFLAFPAVGLFLAGRFPRNAVGWLFLAGPALVGLGVSIGEFAEATGRVDELSEVSESIFSLGLIAVGSAFMLLPTGRYPNRGFAVAHAALLAGIIVVPEQVDVYLLLGLVLLVFGSLVFRFARGDETVRRQLAGPFLMATVGVLSIVLIGSLLPEGGDPSTGEPGSWVGWVEVGLFMIISVGVPVAIAVAIAKYRLYEIDRLVSRTIAYSILVALLGSLFAVAALWIPATLAVETPMFTAGATLLTAGLFNPVRRRIQKRVDRRFNRMRYDAERVVGEFASSLQGHVDPDGLVAVWVATVTETVQPTAATVWMRN